MKSTAFLASALFGSTSALVGPAWTYDSSVEKPTGEKTVGGSTFLVYTLEQQARLGVDASGQPATLASVGMSVNAGNHGWKACPMASMRFGDFSDVKKTLGARLRTDAGYVDAKLPIGEEDFAPATSIPAAFDSRTQWGSNCTVVTTVRDQSACGSWCVLLASSAFPYLRHPPPLHSSLFPLTAGRSPRRRRSRRASASRARATSSTLPRIPRGAATPADRWAATAASRAQRSRG